MKPILNKLLLPLAGVLALGLAACSDWTETESLDINYPSIEEQNPALYAKYLEALRNYKARNHKVVFVTMENHPEAPQQQNHHLTNMPDSVDFICVTRPADMHPMLVSEIGKVYEKGTRVVYDISYDQIETLWKQQLEAEQTQPQPKQEDDQTESSQEERFLSFCRAQVEQQLAYCARFGFDGLQATYTGQDPASMSEEVKALHTARQQAFFAPVENWKQNNAEKVLFFRGSPQNVFTLGIFSRCDYLILPAHSATSGDELTRSVLLASAAGVPTDRFIVGVTIPSLTDPNDFSGYFTDYEADGKTRMRATKGAARWVIAPGKDYTRAGIAIDQAQNDYYNLTLVYRHIREAIGVMNYAPKN